MFCKLPSQQAASKGSTEVHLYRQISRQAYKQADRQIGRQTDRQTSLKIESLKNFLIGL